MQAVRLAIVLHGPERVEFRHAVRGARVERRRLLLRHLLHLAVQLARGRLVEARLHAREANRLQQAHRAERVHVARELGRVERHAHMALCRQIVHLVRIDLVDDPHQVGAITEVAVVQKQLHAVHVRILVEVVDARRVERARPADDAVHLVALLQQQFREVGPVLPRDARDQRSLAHSSFLFKRPDVRRPASARGRTAPQPPPSASPSRTRSASRSPRRAASGSPRP